ncbi:MAG: UTP--glucose-1-phosphate uridylyltransferase, partial [Verrucomicrobia bacterium]|nr:UTP--glucose-1-phosphate uridylyltransferase [Verrucomicrobiota bacterium]
IIDPRWKRGDAYAIDPAIKRGYDLVIERPSPTDWVTWQRGTLIPKLKWDKKHDLLYERFQLPPNCIGVQISAEIGFSSWRNWPHEKWQELFDRCTDRPILLFGVDTTVPFTHPNLIDLRGKTTLFELLSIIQHRVSTLILPDSGIASMVYYLNESFPIRLITFWADPMHGILKQNVPSPNPQLSHRPLIAQNKNLSTLTVDAVMSAFEKNVLPILLAGGQGTRLGVQGPKGLFEIAGKTLFQWFCDKLPKNCPLAIMTSPLNHEATVAYFQKHHFFNLDIHFFQQEMAQTLDEHKQPTGPLAPNGNGSVFRSFVKAGLADKFAKRGIDCVTIHYIDNLLGRPLDPKLLEGLEEVTIQCIQREKEDRSMGVLVEREGRFEIVEYTELDPTQEYPYAYSGGLGFDFAFFCKMGDVDLPLHWVQKSVNGQQVWVGEQFIFDCLKYAKKVRPVCVDRKTHYAPIKGRESVAKALNMLVKQ